jgi:hypothetical protein
MKNKIYNISYLEYETNCTAISPRKWDKLMQGHKRANFYEINKLLKKFVPEMFESFGFDLKPLKELNWFNPYHYYRTEKHFIIVHSGIEYFFKYK